MGAMADTLSCRWQGEVRLDLQLEMSALRARLTRLIDSSAHARTDGSSTTLQLTLPLNCLLLYV
jgi:hypothetical protein